MKRIIKHKETLVYYDGPELFRGVDQFNTNYLCLFVEAANGVNKYLCQYILVFGLRPLLNVGYNKGVFLSYR